MPTHINKDDRIVIAQCLQWGDAMILIAEKIGKNKSSISREIERNKDADGVYRAVSAQKKADTRRRRSKQRHRLIDNNPVMKEYVETKLHPLVSPETIAHDLDIHYQTIYAFIYRSPHLIKLLPQRGRRRRKYGSKREKKQGWTKEVRVIDERIETDINWEGDTVVGPSKARVLTHVERKSLYLEADWIPDGTADTVHACLKKNVWKDMTVTYDRGSEFALWKMIERDTGASVYFAHAHHPWERGKNENTNGRLRRIFPKKFDFATIKQKELDRVVWKMNHTKRKSLAWRTPCEVYGRCCDSG